MINGIPSSRGVAQLVYTRTGFRDGYGPYNGKVRPLLVPTTLNSNRDYGLC
jgi:hypothetical protein